MLIKQKLSERWWSAFDISAKKEKKNILGVAHNDLFSVQIGSKKTILRRFYQLFFRTSGLQHKLLKLIVSPNIFHEKSAKKR